MLYLVALAVVSLALLPVAHGHLLSMIEHLASEGAKPRPRVIQPFMLVVVMLAMGAPVVTSVLPTSYGLGEAAGRDSVYAALLGGSLCICLSLSQFRGLWTAGRFGFWQTGQVVALAGAGLLVAFASVQHLRFFTSNADGWANLQLIKQISPVEDMQGCDSPVVLIHSRPDGMVDYRCPGVVLFNQQTAQPFAPWPGYVEGTSKELLKALAAITDQAQHLD